MIWYFLTSISVGVLLGLLYLLIIFPEVTLIYFWNVLIPIVPIILLIAPGFWRNVCPVAYLSQLPQLSGLSFNLQFPVFFRQWAFYIAFVTLFITVLARKFVFNTDAQMLLFLIMSLGVIALITGIVYGGKSGWCTSFCPIYPVERLYGQNPTFEIKNCFVASNDTCTNCTTKCFDKVRNSNSLMYDADDKTEYEYTKKNRKLFAGMFPGFIFGYFIVPDYPETTIFNIYTEVFFFSMMTYALYNILEPKFKQTGRDTFTALFGAMAFNIYYYFTIDNSLHTFFPDNETNWWIAAGIKFVIFALSLNWIGIVYKNEHKAYVKD
jgi:hypothetical protein